MSVNTFTAYYSQTTEKELRLALATGKSISLALDSTGQDEVIPCSAFVGNDQWLRLGFNAPNVTYYFDNTRGWYSVNTPESEDEISQQVHAIAEALENKEDKMSVEQNSSDGDIEQTILPDTEYLFSGTLTSLSVTLGGDESGHYRFFFVTPPSPLMSLQIAPAVILPDGFAVSAGRVYEVDIYQGLASIQSWGVAK